MVIFLRDPMTAQPHDPDINALVRACDVHDVPVRDQRRHRAGVARHAHAHAGEGLSAGRGAADSAAAAPVAPARTGAVPAEPQLACWISRVAWPLLSEQTSSDV